MFNKAFYLTVLAFLGLVSDQLSAQLRGDIASRKVTLIDETLYVKKEITGGGIINLIDATTLNVPGICNFDKNLLQTGRIVVFDSISIGYKSDAAASKEGSITYNAVCPVELQNAIFVITQNGKKIIEKPVIDLHNLAAGNNSLDQYTELKSLCMLVDDKNISMQLVFPPNVALAGGTHHYISVRLNGLQTVAKA